MELNPTWMHTNPRLDIVFGPQPLANVPERFIGLERTYPVPSGGEQWSS